MKKILFIADHAKGERKALHMAIDFAMEQHARVTVLDVVQKVSTNDPALRHAIGSIQDTLVDQRLAQLRALVADEMVCRTGASPTCRVVPGIATQAIIAEVIRGRFDLVAKSADVASAASAGLFSTGDLRLMRSCPCPVWIIKPGGKAHLKRILVAVDPRPDNLESRALGAAMLDAAGKLARMKDAELHVLHVWEHPLDDRLHGLVSPADLKILEESARIESKLRFDELLHAYPGLVLQEHFVEGRPARVIPELVNTLGVDLVVMGTLACASICEHVLGSTAERVLHEVNCSVLTFKPNGTATI